MVKIVTEYLKVLMMARLSSQIGGSGDVRSRRGGPKVHYPISDLLQL